MIYKVSCSKCTCTIETITRPTTTGFLCNSCHMMWKDIERKYTGEGTGKGPRAYQDELNKAFIAFVNQRPWS